MSRLVAGTLGIRHREWLEMSSLRNVSLAARGLWIDLLCIFRDSPEPGKLLLPDGRRITTVRLAAMLQSSLDDIRAAMAELQGVGMVQQAEDGTFYSTEIGKREKRRRRCATAGRKGGNPGIKTKQKAQDAGRAVEIRWDEIDFPAGCDNEAIREAIALWMEYRRRIHKAYKWPEKQIGILLRRHGSRFPQAVSYSIGNGYQGCIAPPKPFTPGASNGQRHPDDAGEW